MTENLNAELQELRSCVTSVREEKDKIQELLDCAQAEGASLRSRLQESEETVRTPPPKDRNVY